MQSNHYLIKHVYAMLKIFQKSQHGHSGGDHGHNHHDSHDTHDHRSVEVKVEDGDIVEEELGQVALDILDCHDMIVVIAPIAGMDTDNIDISISRNILTIS